MSVVVDRTRSSWNRVAEQLWGPAIVAAVVFAASLFGILTRPVGFLAILWPANAILLGIMLRNPALASTASWLAAFAAYLAADLLTGGELNITLWLTAANLVGAITGNRLYHLLPARERRLGSPRSVLYLFLVCIGAALVAALTGGGAARVLFGRDLVSGIELWFVTELVNNIIILPAMLSFPGWRRLLDSMDWRVTRRTALALLPAASLAVSCWLGAVVDGPGVIAFPVPALIWCALSYPIFATAVATMMTCAWMQIAIPAGIIELSALSDTLHSINSVRLGIVLIALAPLTVASINATRNEALMKLSHAAEHDGLTGALARGAFMERGCKTVARMSPGGSPTALLMIDADHFKSVNDRFGHATGDKVLIELARLVRSTLRAKDFVGRIGGEEFAVVLPETTLSQAVLIAERIRTTVAETPIGVAAETCISISVSIGVSVSVGVPAGEGAAEEALDRLMAVADGALYAAKAAGRNRVLTA